MDIRFTSDGSGFFPVLQPQASTGEALTIQKPVECRYLDGSTDQFSYETAQESTGSILAGRSWLHQGFTFELSDQWRPIAANSVRLERRLLVGAPEGESPAPSGNGFQFHMALQLGSLASSDCRFFAPAMIYAPSQYAGQQLVSFSDHRLAYPLVAAYLTNERRVICLSRVHLATFDDQPVRPRKEQRYLQKTDIGATGFSQQGGTTALHFYWPYYEGEKSALLNAQGSPAEAFYPLEGVNLELSLVYEIDLFEATSFADAVLGAFKNAYALSKPQPPSLPFSLPEAIGYRLSSMAKTYREWAEDGAGFILNFDPERGYDTQAKAFGASFTTHQTSESQDILEYGFTGRQLNAAYTLAQHYKGNWLQRGQRVVDFFVHHMTLPSGWVSTLYHLGKQRPLYTVGDPDGPILHYLALSPRPGNYTRMMVEALSDLLLNYQFHRRYGNTHQHWLVACNQSADFLIGCQNPDGSWYRAYSVTGEPIRSGEWFGTTEEAAKSATCIPVPYLLAVATELGDAGQRYVEAARRACQYILDQHVASDEYRGGTLDNPNVVDKEAALLTMRALLALYERLGDAVYLRGAERAAKLAVTWNSIWNVPNVPGTRLVRAGVLSTGWGGINSIWGAGVTDIYSLFFLGEFAQLSRLTGEPIYADVAQLVARGTQQILSYPGHLFGFADIGMQPEGISFCNQGVDDGLIAKGDIWGGLGWIYTAGTFGLSCYLDTKGG